MIDSTGRTLPDGAGWGAKLRMDRNSDPWAIYSKLDTLAPDDARAQMDANLSTLRSGVPSDVLTSAEATILPLGKARNMYGVAVDLRVSSLQAFEANLGDAILGLGTGLVGGSDTLIEGFAVRIRDDQGAEAGGWSSTRTGHGSLVGTPCRLRITMAFTSRTGGADKPVGSGSNCGAAQPMLGPPLNLEARGASKRLTARRRRGLRLRGLREDVGPTCQQVPAVGRRQAHRRVAAQAGDLVARRDLPSRRAPARQHAGRQGVLREAEPFRHALDVAREPLVVHRPPDRLLRGRFDSRVLREGQPSRVLAGDEGALTLTR